MKRIFVRLPLRSLVKFLWIYVVRLGFLDGIPGLIFSFLMAEHEMNINIKRYEKCVMTRRLRMLNTPNPSNKGKVRCTGTSDEIDQGFGSDRNYGLASDDES